MMHLPQLCDYFSSVKVSLLVALGSRYMVVRDRMPCNHFKHHAGAGRLAMNS